MTDRHQLEQERERLALLCALDRAQLRLQLIRTRRATQPSLAPLSLAHDVLLLTRFLPGATGRWSRRFSFISTLFQGLR